MIQRSWRFIICSMLLAGLIALSSLFFLATPVANAASFAQNAHLASSLTHARPAAGQGHATIIVLDMSGSMSQHDSQGYRCSAADAYIDLSGTNDYIGLVGLDNNNGNRTGSGNFESAQPWTNPLGTATVQQKQNLKNIISNQSHSCRPDANTPTYDALNQAYNMLDTVTRQQGVTGSVILLTDGVPCPDVDGQINGIRNDLLPKFQARGWQIDTIGLGEDAPISSGIGCTVPGTLAGTFHDFLKGVSSATGGQFYDDGQGPVSGVSPLNIATFFVNIFAKYSGLTPRLEIPPTPLNGGTLTQNFNVVDGSTTLEVVAIKENANVSVTLSNPNNQPISPNDNGVFVSQDDFHVIYKIDQPQPGPWIINASGIGQFMMYSLQATNIALVSDGVQLENSPLAAPRPLPLGQTLVVKAHLTNNGQHFSDSKYTLNGSISTGGGSQDCAHPSSPFPLSGNAGDYTGTVSVPATSPAGTYDILICASTGTLQNVVASGTFPVRLEIFPIPSFLSPQTSKLTDTPISSTIVQWPLPVQWFYSLPLVDHLSGAALQNLPAQPYANLPGAVQWDGHLYPGAKITATYTKLTTTDCPSLSQNSGLGGTPLSITQDGQGNFTAQFQPPTTGNYEVVFETGGTFKDSQGSFGPTVRCINVSIVAPTAGQLEHVLLMTLLFIVIFVFLILLARFYATPRPFGQWVRNQGSLEESNRSFGRARRSNPLQWFLERNHIYSRQAGMPRGLEFRFRYGKRIEVRPHKTGRSDWQLPDGSRLSARFQRTKELVYRPRGIDDGDFTSQARFTIMPTVTKKSGNESNYGGYGDYSGYAGYGGGSTKQKKGGSGLSLFGGRKPPKRGGWQ